MTKLPGWANAVIAAAVIAGGSGLVLTRVNAAELKDIKAQQAAAAEAQIKIREDISSLKKSVEKIEERQKEDRDERRAAEQKIDQKLDELLRK